MATGYGMATLAYLCQDDRQFVDQEWDRCGTIMDLFASFITGSQDVTISTHNAYSWGYCDGTSWNEQIKEKLRIPLGVQLPTIVDPGYVCGKTRKIIDFFADDLIVTVPLGDLQSSMFPLLKPNEAVLHLGTSAQIAFSSTLEATNEIKYKNALTILPYFVDKRLITAASLNGGNALECFIEQIAAWSHELFENNLSTSRRSSAKLLQMALDDSSGEKRSSLRVSPLFFGERHNPTAKASMTGLTPSITFTQALQEVARGTIRNLAKMMSPEILQKFNVHALLMINRATQRVYLEEAADAFAPLCVYSGTGLNLSAAYGAAVFLLKSFYNIEKRSDA